MRLAWAFAVCILCYGSFSMTRLKYISNDLEIEQIHVHYKRVQLSYYFEGIVKYSTIPSCRQWKLTLNKLNKYLIGAACHSTHHSDSIIRYPSSFEYFLNEILFSFYKQRVWYFSVLNHWSSARNMYNIYRWYWMLLKILHVQYFLPCRIIFYWTEQCLVENLHIQVFSI